MGNATAAIYAAAKGGVAAMSRCLAREFAPAVRVNVVAPWIRTQWLDGAGAEIQQRVTDATPLARPGTPDDVAEAVAFLASPEAAIHHRADTARQRRSGDGVTAREGFARGLA